MKYLLAITNSISLLRKFLFYLVNVLYTNVMLQRLYVSMMLQRFKQHRESCHGSANVWNGIKW